MDLDSIGKELGEFLSTQAEEIGVDLTDDYNDAVMFAAERAAHLSTIVDQPGFSEAMEAERDSVALRITSAAIERADSIDARFMTVVSQVLSITARALAVVV